MTNGVCRLTIGVRQGKIADYEGKIAGYEGKNDDLLPDMSERLASVGVFAHQSRAIEHVVFHFRSICSRFDPRPIASTVSSANALKK